MIRETIVRAEGQLRKEAAQYLSDRHYMRSSGGSGYMYAVVNERSLAGAVLIGATPSPAVDASLVGACLIGPMASAGSERTVATSGVCVRQIKRSHLLDTSAMYESHLLRHCMQDTANRMDRTVLFVSYADPAATDERTGIPLSGWCYLAAGFFYVGDTTHQRWCVVDHQGRARSTRQGSVTLSRRTLPKRGETFHGEEVTEDWQMHKLPPARIWIAIQTPDSLTRRQAKHAWRVVWQQFNPERRIAARRWISHREWFRSHHRIAAIGLPRSRHLRQHDRFQPAWWPAFMMTRTAAPVWVPPVWQQRLLLWGDVEGETTANRQYAPLERAKE